MEEGRVGGREVRADGTLTELGEEPASTGWTVEIGPFPGWRDVPTW